MSETATAAPTTATTAPATDAPASGKPATPKTSTPNPVPKAEAKGPPSEHEKSPAAEDLFEIVVDGETRQLTRDQARRQLQKNIAAEKRFKEAKQITEKNQRLLQMLSENPSEALTELGLDVRSFAQQVLAREAEDALLSPEEREQRDLRQRLQTYEEREKQQQAEYQRQQQTAQDERLFESFEKTFLGAAERNGLEGTPGNLVRMIEVASEALELGAPLDPDQVVAEVREREDAAFAKLEKAVLGGLKGEALAKRLGQSVVDEVLRWTVEKLNAAPAYQAKPPATETSADRSNVPEYLSESEYNRKYAKR